MDRTCKIQSAFFGTPLGTTENTEILTSVLSEFQVSRLEASSSDVLAVYPELNGYYTVLSPDATSTDVGTSSVNKYTVDMLYEDAPTCTCEDFQFNHTVSDGTKCKHMWKIQRCITNGALPEPQTPVMPWAYTVIDEDITYIKSTDQSEVYTESSLHTTSGLITRLHSLRENFFSQTYHDRNLIEFCQSRAYILTDFQTLIEYSSSDYE